MCRKKSAKRGRPNFQTEFSSNFTFLFFLHFIEDIKQQQQTWLYQPPGPSCYSSFIVDVTMSQLYALQGLPVQKQKTRRRWKRIAEEFWSSVPNKDVGFWCSKLTDWTHKICTWTGNWQLKWLRGTKSNIHMPADGTDVTFATADVQLAKGRQHSWHLMQQMLWKRFKEICTISFLPCMLYLLTNAAMHAPPMHFVFQRAAFTWGSEISKGMASPKFKEFLKTHPEARTRHSTWCIAFHFFDFEVWTLTMLLLSLWHSALCLSLRNCSAVVVYRLFEALEFKARFQSTLAAEAMANNAVVKSIRSESHGPQKPKHRLSLGAASAASSGGSSVTLSASHHFTILYNYIIYTI